VSQKKHTPKTEDLPRQQAEELAPEQAEQADGGYALSVQRISWSADYPYPHHTIAQPFDFPDL
jgi:hypothetical protein